jgi:hypothetical protein
VSIAIRDEVPTGYRSGFVVCGLPEGVQARFDPNPSVSAPEQVFGPISSAKTKLTVSTFWNAVPNVYGLEVFAYHQDANGDPTGRGSFVDPQALVLTIDDERHVSLQPAFDVIPTNGQGCSPAPTGFGPVLQPTPSPSEIQVSATVSNANPAPNGAITLSGSIKGRGQPLANVPAQFTFYGPYAMPSCNTFTDFQGVATCSRLNTNPLHGYRVLVQVTFQYDGRTYTAYTSYVM